MKLGYCLLCDAKVHTECASCGTKKFTDQFTNVEVQWSNGSKMKIGICVPCGTLNKYITPEAKAKITKAHHDYWDSMSGTYDKAVVIV